jgi:hypothetical protein
LKTNYEKKPKNKNQKPKGHFKKFIGMTLKEKIKNF